MLSEIFMKSNCLHNKQKCAVEALFFYYSDIKYSKINKFLFQTKDVDWMFWHEYQVIPNVC